MKALGFCVKLLDVGLLVSAGNHEFADLLERDIVGLTPSV